MNNVNELYELWLKNTQGELREELEAIRGNDDEILDRFYRNLEFGTAGLRGVLGAGTNRMNTYTVCQATQGLADYINADFGGGSVAIGFDSRINSDVFAKQCAAVLAANGIKVYLFGHLVPTPMISFAIRRLGCQSGIVITASHNPSKYNGYKCYDPSGYQMTDEAAMKTYGFISRVDMFGGTKTMDYDLAVEQGMIEIIGEDIIEEFYSLVMQRIINPEVAAKAQLKVIYTPLNGTGNIPVRTVLARAGFENVKVVPEQELPDGKFPTCPYPNPEIRQAFECALAMAQNEPADLLLATDPDCDRVGIAVKDNDGYTLLSGNDVGVLLTEYMLSARKANGSLPANAVMTKSFVSTPLVDLVAAKYGCKVVDVLTGFKYVGEFITGLERKGSESDFVMGFEESYGYLIGTHARDKDAVAASMMICEMASYYKLHGKSLIDVLNDIYKEFGFYINRLYNFAFEGASGMAKMAEIMDSTRAEPPKALAGMQVLEVLDFEARQRTVIATGDRLPIELPRSNVLAYRLPNGSLAIVRPSGTEPKIKVYVTACAESSQSSVAQAEKIGSAMKTLLKIE